MGITNKQFDEMSEAQQNATLFLMFQDILNRVEQLEATRSGGGVTLDGAPEFVKAFVKDQNKVGAK